MRTEKLLIWFSDKLKTKINHILNDWKIKSFLSTSNLKTFATFLGMKLSRGRRKGCILPLWWSQKMNQSWQISQQSQEEEVPDVATGRNIVWSGMVLYHQQFGTTMSCSVKHSLWWQVNCSPRIQSRESKWEKEETFLITKVIDQYTLKTQRLKSALCINP